MLDNPWKIAALVAALILLRVGVGAWKKAPSRAFLAELLNSALIAFGLVFLLIRPFLLQAFFIPSGSMEPTLHHPEPEIAQRGDRILVNKFIYQLTEPRRGDIVVFRAPPQAYRDHLESMNGVSDFYIKRAIGLPGDRVQVRAGEGVFINGSDKPLAEPYLAELPNYDWPVDSLGQPLDTPYVVPEGSILVMGDNRNNSNDSHLWRNPLTGQAEPALPIKNVLGRSLIVFWPLNRFGRLTH